MDLLAVQGILKSLLQYYSSKASILRCSAFMLQLSHLYMNIGKIIALSIEIFVGKVMSLLLICNLRLPLLFFQEQVYFTFMTAVTIHNNFEAQINLVQFSHTVVPDSLQPHGLQHARLPCPSPIPGACSNSFPLSR